MIVEYDSSITIFDLVGVRGISDEIVRIATHSLDREGYSCVLRGGSLVFEDRDRTEIVFNSPEGVRRAVAAELWDDPHARASDYEVIFDQRLYESTYSLTNVEGESVHGPRVVFQYVHDSLDENGY